MTKVVEDWAKDGMIQKLETQYHISHSKYAEELRAKYSKRIVAGVESDGFCRLVKQLYITTGINLSIAYDPFDRTRFLHGLLVTIELSAITIVLSIVIGVIGAWLQGSRLVWTRRSSAATSISSATPRRSSSSIFSTSASVPCCRW